MKKIKFIHCADLHLDSPFVGLRNLPSKIYEQTKQSTFASFSKIIDTAIEEMVDFIIIAGDIYDGEDRSIRAQLFFREQMENLAKKGIHVFLVYGNHDHLGGNWTKLTWPNNVHEFPPTVETIPFESRQGSKIHFYGFSYSKKHVTEHMIDFYTKKEQADFHIGILHGHDSTNKSHYSYAPFKVNELLEKNFRYWALGHIHKSQILHMEPTILYPGNIQGRHKNESGAKGCYLIEMDEATTKVDFIETAPIRWEKEILGEEEKYSTFDELYTTLQNIKEAWRETGKNVFLQISVHQEAIADSVFQWFQSEEMIEFMQEGEVEQTPFVWLYELSLEESEQRNVSDVPDEFSQKLKQQLYELDLQEPLASLYNNPKTRRFLNPLTEEEQQDIIRNTEKIIYQLLKL